MKKRYLILLLALFMSFWLAPGALAENEIPVEENLDEIIFEEQIEMLPEEFEIPQADIIEELPEELVIPDEILEEELEEIMEFEAAGLVQHSDRIYEFSSFEALRQLASGTLTERIFAFCSRDVRELVIRTDFVIPKNLTVIVGGSLTAVQQYGSYDFYIYSGTQQWNAAVRVENGVTLEIKGELETTELIVDGDVTISVGAMLKGFQGGGGLTIKVYGAVKNYGSISAREIEGLNLISNTSGAISVNQSASSVSELTEKLLYDEDNKGINTTYHISLYSSKENLVFSDPISIPSNAELSLTGYFTLADSCKMTVYGEVELQENSYGMTELQIHGQLKNSGRVTISSSGDIRLSLGKGGYYGGTGGIYLSQSQTASACMRGFDISKFVQSANGSYRVYTLEDYQEPWADGEFSSFEELKEWAESRSEVELKRYTGTGPLVIEEDLTLGFYQNFHVYPADIIVPEGVTFTVQAPMSCHSLIVRGTMHAHSWITTGYEVPDDFALQNPNFVEVTGQLYLYATLNTSRVTGVENIRFMDDNPFDHRSMIFLTIFVQNEEQLKDVFYQAQYDISDRKEYCPTFYRDFTLTRDLAVPVGCSLDLNGGRFTIAETARLTISGGMELNGGTVLVNGKLENENEIEVFGRGTQVTLKNSSCYEGPGMIKVYFENHAAALKGFDFTRMYVAENGGVTSVTNSKKDYNEIIERQKKTETIISAEATVQFCQTEARSQLQYINAFRANSADNQSGSYGALQYSYALEEIAMQRAAEIAIDFDCQHMRPSGGSFSTLLASDGSRTMGENLASGATVDSAYEAYMLWREDGLSYSQQGHRRNMLNASWKSVGIGCVKYCNMYFWVQEFSTSASSGTSKAADDSMRSVSIDIVNYNISSYQNVAPDPSDLRMKPGERAGLPRAVANAVVYDSFGILTDPPKVETSVNWSSSDPSVAAIVDGNVVALRTGSALLTGKAFDQSVAVSVWVEGTAATRLPGDVNHDGAVNGLDVVRFRKYLSGEAVTIDRSNGDINNDGKTNARDLRTIRRYLAGADVTLK